MAGLLTLMPTFIKRFLGVSKTLKTCGYGRTIIKINEKYQFVSNPRIRRWIKLSKILFHPIDAIKRFFMARSLQRSSNYKDFLPKTTGFRAIALSDIPEAKKAITSTIHYFKNLKPIIDSKMGKTNLFFPLLEETPLLKGLANAGVYHIREIPGLTELIVSPTIIETASAYLGEVPILASIMLYVSLPNFTEELEGSQLFHRDAEDLKQVQFIFAITDVDHDAGPFTLIPADKSESIQPNASGRLSDEEVFKAIGGRDNVIELLGPAGSAWIVDNSSCLHFGSRNTKVRCHLQLQYFSRFAPAESLFHFSELDAKLPEKLSELQNMVMSNVVVKL